MYELGLTEVDIDRASDAAPIRDVASGILQEIVDRNEVENDAGALEGGSFAAPVTQHVRAVSPRCRWVPARLRVRSRRRRWTAKEARCLGIR